MSSVYSAFFSLQFIKCLFIVSFVPTLGHCRKYGNNVESISLLLDVFFFFLGRDIIGLAETGSGKTGAFALPILNALLETPQRLFALVLTPTRELAFQISEQFEALGSSIGVQSGKYLRGKESQRFFTG